MASPAKLYKEATIEEDKQTAQRNIEISAKIRIDPDLRSQNIQLGKGSMSFQTPARIVVSGPTESGKSTLILEILKDREHMFSTKFKEIHYCMPKMIFDLKEKFSEKLEAICPEIKIIEGLPNIAELAEENSHRLIILDDLSEESTSHHLFKKMLNVFSHHCR